MSFPGRSSGPPYQSTKLGTSKKTSPYQKSNTGPSAGIPKKSPQSQNAKESPKNSTRTKLAKSKASPGSRANVPTSLKKGILRPNSSPRSTTPTTGTISGKRPIIRSGECEVCKQTCRSHCAGCKRVFYCCKQHQQTDWSNHKLVCRPFSIPTQYSSTFHLRPPGVSKQTLSTTTINSKATTSPVCSQTKVDGTHPSAAELQFMISTKQIDPGNTVVIEKPLLVTANIFQKEVNKLATWCGSCLQVIKSNDSNGNSALSWCSKCKLPLCQNCISDPTGNSQRFHPGQGHPKEECAFLSECALKFPQLTMNGCDATIKDLTILRIIMFRTLSPWRWESLIALRNSPRYEPCCKHNFGQMDGWLGPDFANNYTLSNHYLTNICKEKSIQLPDIVKIVAIFCEVSVHNPSFLVLYESQSWIAHACTPNAQQIFRKGDQSLELTVKAVNIIEEGSKVFMNYLPNFDGSQSTLAQKLFQNKGLYCCDTECACRQGGFDKTLGIRCDLFPLSGPGGCNTCSGIISPNREPPNPEKANLGVVIFAKSKKWECDKCKRSEKYAVLQSKIMEIAQNLMQECDTCCNENKGQTFLQLQSKLLANVSDQHWMVWKAKLRILKTWNDLHGYGTEMLKSAVALPVGSPMRESLIRVAKNKVDLYGNGIYEGSLSGGKSKGKVKTKVGVLEFIGKRHGVVSPQRGEMLFDAFYANLILLIEDYKKELPLPATSVTGRNQVASETVKRLGNLRDILEQAVNSLKVYEDSTTPGACEYDHSQSFRIASQSLEVLNPICTRAQKIPSSVIEYMNNLLEMYACVDTNFLNNCLNPSKPRKDPLSGDFDLEFEVDSINCGPVFYTFGTAGTGSSSATSKSSSFSSKANEKSRKSSLPKSNFFSFSKFDSTFGSSPNFDSDIGDDDDDDDDDIDSPFVYSRKTEKKPASPKTTGSNKSKADKGFKEEDWFSYLSDDDDSFSTGFSGTMPDIDDDIYNDDALEDLAEWAALQFMMGKMKI